MIDTAFIENAIVRSSEDRVKRRRFRPADASAISGNLVVVQRYSDLSRAGEHPNQ